MVTYSYLQGTAKLSRQMDFLNQLVDLVHIRDEAASRLLQGTGDMTDNRSILRTHFLNVFETVFF